MKSKLLAVMPESTNYSSNHDVTIARSFEEAKAMIIRAEQESAPYDDLDLSVRDEVRFWKFVDWMEETDRKYPFSIFGHKSTIHFVIIADRVRRRGFFFNS